MSEIPEELYDGYSVYRQVEESTGRVMTAEQVSDVLDAVVALMKKRLTTNKVNDDEQEKYRVK